MGVAAALAVGSLAVGVGGLVAGQINAGNQQDQAKKAAAAQAAQATSAQQQQQAAAAALSPEIQAQNAQAQQLAAAGGIQNQSSVFNQQQQLANQLQIAANGGGPNPALAQLAQTTGQNVASQAALQAGQRGAGANVGLMARQVGQQGAVTQQAATGQAATLSAQQQIAARQQLGQQQASMAGVAGQQVNEQMTAQQQATQAALGQGQIASGMALGQGQLANQSMGQSLAAQQAGNQALMTGVGGLASGMGAAAQSPAFQSQPNLTGTSQGSTYGGGETPGPQTQAQAGMANGGEVGPKSYVTQSIYGKSLDLKMAMGGKVPAMVSPGERYLPPKEAKKVLKGTKDALVAGMKIKGKAKVKGDSETNDTVPKTLTEGGVVIPRTIVDTNSPEAANNFVKAAKSKSNKK